MSMTQITTEVTPSGEPHCPSCGIQLPPQATFCASCGERVKKTQVLSLLEDNRDIATRYRITSLVRRRPPVGLFLATDTEQQRPVALRDIDMTSLNDEARGIAAATVQREYDLLRRQHIPFIIPLIDLRHFQGHLYVVAGWPRDEKGPNNLNSRNGLNGSLHTLQDVLQSGKGLPEESLALTWIEHLCQSLQDLHAAGIVVADLDAQTIILNSDTYDGELALMVSWLPLSLRTLFPRISTIANTTNYTAPEVLLGKPEPRSDIYSLGALLYLLLTGTPPEEPMARTQRRLRLPGELNSRLSSSLDDFIAQALAIDVTERFSNADAMREALIQLRTGGKRTNVAKESSLEKIVSADTILITPLPESSRNAWQSSPIVVPVTPANNDRDIPQTPPPDAQVDEENEFKVPDLAQAQTQAQPNPNIVATDSSLAQRVKRHITGLLPAIPRIDAPKAAPPVITAANSTPVQSSNRPVAAKPSPLGTPGSNSVSSPGAISAVSAARTPSFFQKLQHLILGEQKQATTAAAIVETPLRVQPNQHYHIRIHVMGRNTPMVAPDSKNGAIAGGLSSLVEGDIVSIEVRSALYQNYAYVVQQAMVQIPESGYAAEVTIPMQPLSSGPSGRRDRLHIFFMDERRRTLYEKPFVIELFISHLVQPGREGHNVLTIPL